MTKKTQPTPEPSAPSPFELTPELEALISRRIQDGVDAGLQAAGVVKLPPPEAPAPPTFKPYPKVSAELEAEWSRILDAEGDVNAAVRHILTKVHYTSEQPLGQLYRAWRHDLELAGHGHWFEAQFLWGVLDNFQRRRERERAKAAV